MEDKVIITNGIAGGRIRVGLEDTIYIDHRKKTLVKGNRDQVEKAVIIARGSQADTENSAP